MFLIVKVAKVLDASPGPNAEFHRLRGLFLHRLAGHHLVFVPQNCSWSAVRPKGRNKTFAARMETDDQLFKVDEQAGTWVT